MERKVAFSSLAEEHMHSFLYFLRQHQGQDHTGSHIHERNLVKPMPIKPQSGKRGKTMEESQQHTFKIGTRNSGADFSIGMKRSAKRAGLRHQQPTSV
jgi:hypothetical protein